jgi:hypothetical protein
MATTTNYGWTTPDDTALVKDGASAIRTLGSSVDTSVKALNPGTTAGDLDYYTAATTKARIAKGTAGQVFTMNAGATAPEWQTASSGGMTLINTGGTTLSGASVTIGSIPGTYRNLQLVIRNFRPATDAATLFGRFNSDSNTRYRTITSSAITATNVTFNASSFDLTNGNDDTVATGLVIMNIYDYANTATWKVADSRAIVVHETSTDRLGHTNFLQFYNQTSAITDIVLLPSAGNFTSGTAFLYGVK